MSFPQSSVSVPAVGPQKVWKTLLRSGLSGFISEPLPPEDTESLGQEESLRSVQETTHKFWKE